ncbi:hypothetical protein [Pseudobacillus badius]|uniref:hypothetical protein n=1 Tax=Bacillus badius TaxID=1455 RepID=UPI00059771FA|nr:hypothetical protein [Bacillus badius]KIL75639.1 hypothetical protein SD78_2708 [Bacillus badius]KZR59244.1 hypothetical protein A3781_13885 [Bacillus badius]
MQFFLNQRLGILLPHSNKKWSDYPVTEQEQILERWERIRGSIPDRIQALEKEINILQSRLEEEEEFLSSCRINEEISEIASIINDLWIWFRTSPSIENPSFPPFD